MCACARVCDGVHLVVHQVVVGDVARAAGRRPVLGEVGVQVKLTAAPYLPEQTPVLRSLILSPAGHIIRMLRLDDSNDLIVL